MHFEFFDPTQEVFTYFRRLPHWEQSGVMVFITWRTIDSIPESTLRRWRVERAAWLRRNAIDPLAANWREQLRLLPRERGTAATFNCRAHVCDESSEVRAAKLPSLTGLRLLVVSRS
jgi:hypothetical protein